jgi:peptidoglycan/LPS O-acetylase OafA/YrhL
MATDRSRPKLADTRPQGVRASQHLDLLRGLAAVAVLAYHIRYRFFLDYSDLGNHSGLGLAWYGITAFGHDAVMVFFVLSGFLIGSGVIDRCRNHQWDWKSYATARAVRLYLVLLPGLVLTGVLDVAGIHLFGDVASYSGSPASYAHDFFSVPARLTAWAFLGNTVFLQTIVVPPFGSNDALWSLANEFWYYCLFPLVWIAIFTSAPLWRRLAYGILAAALIVFVGNPIAPYFLVWLLGAAIALLPWSALIQRHRALMTIIAGVVLGLALGVSHAGGIKATLGMSIFAADFVVALACAGLLYVLLHDRKPLSHGLYAAVAERLAGQSFTLYVVHLPMLMFVRAWLVPGRPWEPTFGNILTALLIGLCVFAVSGIIARLTEFHTADAKRWIDGRLSTLGGRPRSVQSERA